VLTVGRIRWSLPPWNESGEGGGRGTFQSSAHADIFASPRSIVEKSKGRDQKEGGEAGVIHPYVYALPYLKDRLVGVKNHLPGLQGKRGRKDRIEL